MTHFGLVSNALVRERRFRNLIACFAVAISMALWTVSLSMTAHLKGVSSSFDNGRLTISSRISGLPLTLSSFEQLKRIPEIAPLYYALFVEAELDAHRVGVLAVGPDIEAVAAPRWWQASPEAIACWRKQRQGVIVSDKVLQRIGWQIGTTVTPKLSSGAAVSLVVCGTASGYEPGLIYMHHDYLNELAKGNGALTFVIAECTTSDRRCTNELAQHVDETTSSWAAPAQAMFERQNMDRMIRLVAAVPNLLSRVSILSILITLLITASTLGMSLEERRSEFATLRALGFGRARVSSLIVAESTLLSTIGGLFGAGLPYVFFYRHGFSLGASHASNVPIHLETFLLCAATSLLIGLVVALLPAYKVSRHDVIQGLSQG